MVPSLIGECPRHGLADPPCGIRGELEPLAIVEFFDGPDQAKVALLNEIEQ